MAPLPLTSEPTSFVAGDTLVWERDDELYYPISEGWVLSYEINGKDAVTWEPTWVTIVDGRWRITIPKTATNFEVVQPHSLYRWAAIMEGRHSYTGRRHTIESGIFQVFPNPATALDVEFQSLAEQMVTLLRAAILAFSGSPSIKSYTIGIRSVERQDPVFLNNQLAYWERRLARERRPQQFGRKVQYRMTTPAP